MLLVIVLLQITWITLPRHTWRVVAEWICTLGVATFVLKTQVFSLEKCPHHWAFYLGPLYGVTEGGLLLWDTPSQYGFLSIILPALISWFGSLEPMMAFGIGLALFQIASLAVVVWLLHEKADFSPIVSAVFAGTLLFFFAGWIETFVGSTFYPSVTGFRFLPGLLALLSVDWACRRSSSPATFISALLVAFAWLWSAESIAYTLPGIVALLVVTIIFERDLRFYKRQPFRILVVAALCVALFLLAYRFVAAMEIEPERLFDFALTYSNSQGCLPIQFDRWTLTFVAMLGLCYFFARSSLTWSRRGNLCSVLFLAYAFCVATYFVGRSHENNVRNILVWLVVVLVCCMPPERTTQLRSLLKSFVFIICLCCFGKLANDLLVPRNGVAPWRVVAQRFDSSDWAVLPSYPNLPVAVKDYLDTHLPGQPVTVFESGKLYAPLKDTVGHGFYLPIAPLQQIGVLDESARQVYLQRMIQRKPASIGVCSGGACGDMARLFGGSASVSIVKIAEVGGFEIYAVRSARMS